MTRVAFVEPNARRTGFKRSSTTATGSWHGAVPSPAGVVVFKAPDLTTARRRAAADGLDDGATFVEGRDLGDLALAMSPDVFGRMLSPDEAAALLDSVGGFPPFKGESP
jgi:hypothetical protein